MIPKFLRRIHGVVRKEIVELARQPGLLAILVVGPLLILFVFGAGLHPYDPQVRAIFVAPSENVELQELVSAYSEERSQRFAELTILTDPERAEEDLRQGKADLVVTFPDVTVEGIFEQQERAVVRVQHGFLDPVEDQAIRLFTIGAVDDINDRLVALAIQNTQTIATDLLERLDDDNTATLQSQINNQQREELQALRVEVDTITSTDPMLLASPIRGTAAGIHGQISTTAFYAPAIVALILQHLTLTFVALSVSREQLQKTTELLTISPLRSWERIAGKVVAFLLIGMLLGALLIAAITTTLSVPIGAGILPLAITIALEIFASIGFGFILAGLARNTTQVVQGAMLVLLASVFFGGLIFSPDRLLPWARPIGYLLPMSHAIALLRQTMLRSLPLDWVHLGALAIMTLGTIVLGMVLIRRGEQR